MKKSMRGNNKMKRIFAGTGSVDKMLTEFNNRIEELEGNPDSVMSAAGGPVKLKVEYYPYSRYEVSGKRRAVVSGQTVLEALCKMVDKMQLYIDSEQIDERGLTAEEVIEEIEAWNADGCDYIVYLANETTGEIYIEEDYEEEDEDWDDFYDYGR